MSSQMNGMRFRTSFRIFLAFASFVGLALTAMPGAPAHAVPYTITVFTTHYGTDKGLAYCSVSAAHTCIESITINGVETEYRSSGPTDFRVAGGIYGTPCRFVETTATACDVPYLVVSPYNSALNTLSESSTVVINMRRAPGTDPAARVGAVVVNGALTSFVPSAPGVRDIATVTMQPRRTEIASQGMCVGWVVAIDGCTVAETATTSRANVVSVLMLPGMRTSLVPPDVTDPSCSPGLDPSSCVINVFDSDSQGGWIDTNASIFGLASTDRLTGAAQLKIAGPHYKMIPYDTISTPIACPYIPSICGDRPEGSWGYTYTTVPKSTEKELNTAYFRMFLPGAYLYKSFGLTPTQASALTLPVRRTLSGTDALSSTTYTPTDGGLLINTPDVTFSTPTMNVSRVLTVKKNKKVAAETIIRAAGVSVSKTLYGTPKISVVKSKGMKKVKTKYVFTKSTNYLGVKISFRSSPTTTTDRILTVKVVK